MKTKIKHNSKHSSYKKIICDKKNFYKKKTLRDKQKLFLDFKFENSWCSGPELTEVTTNKFVI